MTKKQALLEVKDYEHLVGSITYLLAGLEGNTDGYQIVSVTLQQAGVSDFRVVLRARGASASGDPVRVVGFSNGGEPAIALLNAEKGYRENVIRWSVDRFAESISKDGESKNGQPRLSITN